MQELIGKHTVITRESNGPLSVFDKTDRYKKSTRIQELANIFWKGPNSKYFRFFRPNGLY